MPSSSPPILWTPSPEFEAESNLRKFSDWLEAHSGLRFSEYADLWQWSVDQPAVFWERIAAFFEVRFHTPYDRVKSPDPMPDTRWFEGATLNYAEHIFRKASDERPALIHAREDRPPKAMSWAELTARTASLRAWLQSQGVKKGDRVAAFLPNGPEATIGFLAACSLGAIWSSCSPDFGASSVVDRFRQIEPTVLLACDGYRYGGKFFDRSAVVRSLEKELTSLKKIVLVSSSAGEVRSNYVPWEATQTDTEAQLVFEAVPFAHPIWVLYSSGTTGQPKAITHSQGGVLLEHLKYLAFHNDLREGERFFWFTTTGWMMWNFLQAALLGGATIVLYDGSPGYPDLHALWRLAADTGVHHFGTSAPFLVACMKQGLSPGNDRALDLSRLRSVGSTGAPLPPEAFDWVYEHLKKEVWLCSMSGGTDLCTAFVGGCPWRPVYRGEIQARCLGAALYAFDDHGDPLVGEVGEMVLTEAMPSMPVFFWNDPDKARYRSSYFDHYPGIWRHGDWVKITERDSLLILGRSDATLNRQGIRIGTAEIYRAVNKIPDIQDSLIVNLELEGGRHFMPLFVLMAEGKKLNPSTEKAIKTQLRSDYSPRHVPDRIIPVAEIPYTISGKKMEAPVKKILLGFPVEKAANRDAMRNPESLDFFVEFARDLNA